MTDKDDLSDVIKLISDIKHKKILNSHFIALETEQLLENLISQADWSTAQDLMDMVKTRIQCVAQSLPQEATVLNIMCHILKVIREEFLIATKRKDPHSRYTLITTNNEETIDYTEPVNKLKSAILDHLTEYKVELETSSENISAQASEHIHSNETILTVGTSSTVQLFLKDAAKNRVFNVIVVEGAPNYQGHAMAAALSKSNIQVTVIPDSAVFASMSRVNKVIIGTHSVLANGGLRASSGIHAVALAAKHYSIPVVVLAHMYKFTPAHIGPQDESFKVCASPANVLPYAFGQILNKVDVKNPIFDYVPPELVTLFISHQGGNAPSYVYRLLSEIYHPDDYEV